MFGRSVLGASLLAVLAMSPAHAGEAGDILRDSLYSGALGDGIAKLTPLADADDSEAQFGLGYLKFFTGVEHLTQSFYRYGLASPDARELGVMIGAVPMPTNPTPDKLTYEGFRAVLEQLVLDMDAAKLELVRAGEMGDYVVSLDPLKFRVDIDGDGKVTDAESVASILNAQFGAEFGTSATEPMPDASVGFDRADAIWLAGYSQVFAVHADLMLAHDFEDLVNSSFHLLFPKAGLPMQDYRDGNGVLFMSPSSDASIADFVAAIHTINMKVTDPARLKGVLARLKSITALSRQNWQAILAETDDSRELVPSPKQTAIIPDGVVTDETVAAWMATLDTADAILDGKLLIPHWRFHQGFDLKAYFENATRTDLVMLLTGYDALPFIKAGPIADAASFAAANRVFGENLLGYAFWFN
jgi:hypothetical protein